MKKENLFSKAWDHWYGKLLYTIIVLLSGGLLTAGFILKTPMDLHGFKINMCTDTAYLVKHDTVKLTIHDTLHTESFNRSKKIDVKSYNQKGGQTAGEIINH